MKKTTILMTALAVIFLTTSISAQPGQMGGGPHDSVMHLNHLQQMIGLSDAQVTKLFNISTKYRKLTFNNRKNPAKLYSIREAHRKEIDAVFTKDQKKMLKKMREMGPEGRKGGRGCR